MDELKKLWDKIKPSLMFVLITAGLLFIVIGHISNFNEKVNIIFRDVGKTILVSGIFAVILKKMQFMGVFREDLSDIIYEDRYLENRKDITVLWARVSKILFHNKFSSISGDIMEDVKQIYFPTDHILYYDNYVQTLEIELIDAENNIVRVIQSNRYTIFPTEANTEFKHPLTNVLKFNADRDEIKFTVLKYTVNGQSAQYNLTERVNDNTLYTRMYVILQGASKYDFETKFEKIYCLDYDNVIGIAKDFLIHDFKLSIYLKGQISIKFFESGTLKQFTPSTVDMVNCFHFNYDGIIYPKQGYMIILENK